MAYSQAYFGNYGDEDQPTLLTVAAYIAAARTLLQDQVAPYRYDDPSLLTALNTVLLEAARLRADLFVWNLPVRGQVPAFQNVDETKVPIETSFRLAILHGLCGFAMERDQEDYTDARVTSFFERFNTGLVGKTLGPMAGGSPPQGHPK